MLLQDKLVEPRSASHLIIRKRHSPANFLLCVLFPVNVLSTRKCIRNDKSIWIDEGLILFFLFVLSFALGFVLFFPSFFVSDVNLFCKKKRKYLIIVLQISDLLAKARL